MKTYKQMNDFRHKSAIQIRFKDIDALGHVNNANHLSYFELARVNYFNEVIGININWAKQGIILAKISVDYKLPVLFEDKITVYTKCSRIGNKSFELVYSLVKDDKEQELLLATGESVLVCYDYTKNHSIEMPLEWRDKMIKYDNL